ncbi:unnamed protein product [Nippostrongylus brasiliensis]|uniref:CHK domain-containing protein n=1 Tax=Nippostrongylus brasiliensis TaxID=27835 RepID=A0A0N4YLJ7_NIPBR|nr:hypothetical protein Q1695_002682 [Nippostrongylus brasiliensis]VDL81708.1 unnamed protein product [Nippostrongylus brasiliensis]
MDHQDHWSDLCRWIVSVLAKEHGQTPLISQKVPMLDALGHMSSIIRLHLAWPSKADGLPASVVLKIPTPLTMDKTFESMEDDESPKNCNAKVDENVNNIFLEMMHEVEAETYAELQKERPEGLRIPHYYGYLPFSSSTPCILMEDVHPGKVYDLVSGFDDAQLYKIVDQLVALHVFCFTHDGWDKIGVAMTGENPAYQEFMLMMEMLNKNLICEYPALKPGLTLLQENLLKNYSWHRDHIYRYRNPAALRTFVHGDLWTANIIWRNGDIAAIIDWTLCRPGALTEDLQRMLAACCTVERRQRMTKPLVEYYYDQVKTKMEGKSMPMPFTFADLQDDYNSTLPFICGQTMFSVAFWLRTNVVRKGGKNDSARVDEMIKRLHSFVDETVQSQKWIAT